MINPIGMAQFILLMTLINDKPANMNVTIKYIDSDLSFSE